MTRRERISEPPPLKIDILQQRAQSLYQRGFVHAQSDLLLSQVFEELANTLAELRAADQALHQQNEEWRNRLAAQELECQRYKDLFEHAPTGYLVTSIDGAIRQANTAALEMLETSGRAIVGRSLAIFVAEGQRRAFREKITQMIQATTPQEWVLSMCSWEGALFEARLSASVLYGANGRPLALYWLMRALNESSTAA
jgi:PAS domain S-box-containing protein